MSNMRESSWRIFAAEYNDATHVVQGMGEKAPKFVITPLGAKINRIYIVGVLTDVENIAKEGIRWRARIADPTGIHNVYAEPFNPEAASLLADMEVPSYVAVAGKARIYEPEEGAVYLSIRAETVKNADAHLRDLWVLEAARGMKMRIDAMREAMSMSIPSVRQLIELGYPSRVAEGVVEAVKFYGDIDIDHYEILLREALNYLVEGKMETRKDLKEVEDKIVQIIKNMNVDDAIEWDEVVSKAMEEGISKEDAEDAISSLMDKGLIYEPELGKIKLI